MIYKIRYENCNQYEEIVLTNTRQYTQEDLEKLYYKAYYEIEAWYEGKEEYDEDDYTIQSIVDEWDYSPQSAVASYLCEYYNFAYLKEDIGIWV